ncbi:MAG: AAA family ATPase [Pseudomonadales bacterium]|nr:AAA family ATPase [Pseudomonadales bacterium]
MSEQPFSDTSTESAKKPLTTLSHDALARQRSEDSLEKIDNLSGGFEGILARVRESAHSPNRTKVLERDFTMGWVAEKLGYSTEGLRFKESEGAIPPQEKDARGRRVKYSLDQFRDIQQKLELNPGRGESENPAVIACANFKGGCGKTTLSVHMAQYLAIRGYRVLFIDADPQASASMLLGSQHEVDLNSDDFEFTLEEYLSEQIQDFSSTIRPCYFPGIDLIPSDILLSGADYHLISRMQMTPDVLTLLQKGIQSVWKDYDVVVIDPPPALGALSLSVLAAVSGLVVPMRPTLVDFDSTYKFLRMISGNLDVIVERGFDIDYRFVTVALNGYDETKAVHKEIVEGMNVRFSRGQLFETVMRNSAEIDNASRDLRSVYDLTGPTGNHKVYKRCVSYLDALFSEVELKIQQGWPSNSETLRAQGRG